MKNLRYLLLLFVPAVLIADDPLPVKIKEVRRLSIEGYAKAPILSPDGRYVAFSGEEFNGVMVKDLETGTIEEFCTKLGSGLGLMWLDDRRLIVRATQDAGTRAGRTMGLELINVEEKSKSPLINFSTRNRIDLPQRTALGTVLVRNRRTVSVVDPSPPKTRVRSLQKSENSWSHDGTRIITGRRAISTPDSRQILSIDWSPDGSRALIQLEGRPSLYLFTKLTGEFDKIAEHGERPSWIDNDRFIFNKVLEEEGEIMSGNIYIASLRTGAQKRLTDDFGGIALHPSISRDGKIAFNTPDGELYVMEIELK